MEQARKKRDKVYQNAFKGEKLVETLVKQDNDRIKTREAGIRFAQHLLDAGHIKSIRGSKVFEDTSHLYQWADQSVVRDARKSFTASSNHIQQEKVLGLINSENGMSLKQKKSLFEEESSTAPSRGPRQRQRHRTRADRRKTIDSARTIGEDHGQEPSETGVGSLSRELSLSAEDLVQSSVGELPAAAAVTSSAAVRSISPSSSSWASGAIDLGAIEELRAACEMPSAAAAATSSSSAARASPALSEVPASHSSLSSPVAQLSIADDTKVEVNNNLAAQSTATCRYDGIDMPALDLENVHASISLSRDSGLPRLLGEMPFEDLPEGHESGSYSDNEKQLLERMKRMKMEHDNTIKDYEEKINGLMVDIKELKELAEKNLAREQNDQRVRADVSREQEGDVDTHEPFEVTSKKEAPKVLAPPKAPPPPSMAMSLVKPNKEAIKPGVRMRTLFWNRIVLNYDNEDDRATFWHRLREPRVLKAEFERIFGKPMDKESKIAKSLHDSISRNKNKVQRVKTLDEKRSRAVGIKLRSLHCQMGDIRGAIYNMDFRRIDLETLYSLYEVRGTAEELDKIKMQVQKNENVPLDEPEQFLLELSEMSHFPERVECLQLRKKCNELLFNIDQQLNAVSNACNHVKSRRSLHQILSQVLALGNYMNGGTQRGQADGFELSILTKLKDVKSMDNNQTLLDYVALVYSREHDEPDGKHGDPDHKLHDSSVIFAAVQVSFTSIDSELSSLQHQIKAAAKKVEQICRDTEPEYLQPFKDKMEVFIDTATEMVNAQQKNLSETEGEFNDLLCHFCVKQTTEQVTPEQFFGIWYDFLESFRAAWQNAQKIIARAEFEKVEAKRKDRIRTAKRRVSDGKSNLKQRFNDIRKKSDTVNPTIRNPSVMRSHSVGVDISETEIEYEQGPPRRRPQSDTAPTAEQEPRRRQERMSERMDRRRRSRVNADDVVASIVTTNNQMPATRTRQRRSENDNSAMVDNRQRYKQQQQQQQQSDVYYHSVPNPRIRHQEEHLHRRNEEQRNAFKNDREPSRRRREPKTTAYDQPPEQNRIRTRDRSPYVQPVSPQPPNLNVMSQNHLIPNSVAPNMIPPNTANMIHPSLRTRRNSSDCLLGNEARARTRGSNLMRQRSHDILADADYQTRSSSPCSQSSGHSAHSGNIGLLHDQQQSLRTAPPISPQYAQPLRRRSSNNDGAAVEHTVAAGDGDVAEYRDALRKYSIKQQQQQQQQNHQRYRPTNVAREQKM